MAHNDRMTDDAYGRSVNVRQESYGAGTIVLVAIVALIGLGLLYWIASSAWGPATDTTIVSPDTTVETVPAPAPGDTVAPMDALPPATETAPAETAPLDAAPAPAPAPEATPAPAPEPAPAPAP
jgi:hypothetical protein